MKSNNKIFGFTAVEFLVIVAILGIIVFISFPHFSKFRENQVLKSGAADVVSALGKAQSKSLSGMNSSPYGVRFESGQVVIFEGTTYAPNDSDNEIVNIASPASITNVVLSGVSGVSGELYFDRLSGAPSKSGTVTLSTSNFSKIITISATGTASISQ